MHMLQRLRFRFAERYRRVRRRLAIWQRRDPKAWIIALIGMAMGLVVFLLTLAWVELLRVLHAVAKSLR
jgi:hypothetical protein